MSEHPHTPPSPQDPSGNKKQAAPQDSHTQEPSASEVAKLRREQAREKRIQQRAVVDRVRNTIYLLVGLLEILLALRFMLRLSGANPENMFTQFIYGLSAPFVHPFSTLFISPAENMQGSIGMNIFDVNLLIAMVMYALLGVLAVWIVTYIYRQISSPNSTDATR